MVKLKNLIAPSFYSVHQDIKKGLHTHYWLKGGRGSCKSSFVSIEIILGMMQDKNANAVVMRKTGFYLKNSVFEQLLWAVSVLEVSEYWEAKLSPLELIYKPGGQRIVFRGADKPVKIKSIKFRQGYCKYAWYEEADQFHGMEEIRTINQSLMRGGESFCFFYSYNPPQSQRSWVNEESTVEREDRLIHHSDYRCVPREWLGEQFFIEAEHLKKVNPEAYQHDYLGEVTGTGGEVFKNVTIRRMTEEEIQTFDHISRGLDWGYAVDPFAYVVNHYDKTRRRLYVFYELYQVNLSNRKAAELVKKENKNNQLIICDSAEPKSIAEFHSYGVQVAGARKGPDSVEYGMKWLQDLEEIVIDAKRCPNTAREFLSYELQKDSEGNWKAGFPDKENHTIDAVRYSREYEMRNTKVR